MTTEFLWSSYSAHEMVIRQEVISGMRATPKWGETGLKYPETTNLTLSIDDIYLFYMPFEYDKPKCAANKKKHGIDFEEAQELWADPDLLVLPARMDDEPRSMAIGSMRGKVWSAVVTMRGGSIRIISVRRARTKEVELYESA